MSVALRHLEKNASDVVREKARGALWSFEDRDQQRITPASTEHGKVYIVFLLSTVLLMK